MQWTLDQSLKNISAITYQQQSDLSRACLGLRSNAVVTLLPLYSLQGGNTPVRPDWPHCTHSPCLLQGPEDVPVYLQVLRWGPGGSPLKQRKVIFPFFLCLCCHENHLNIQYLISVNGRFWGWFGWSKCSCFSWDSSSLLRRNEHWLIWAVMRKCGGHVKCWAWHLSQFVIVSSLFVVLWWWWWRVLLIVMYRRQQILTRQFTTGRALL